MASLEFREPLFLVAILAAPLVWWLASRLPSVVTYSSLELMDRAPVSLRARLAKLPALLLALAALALAVALAGPRTGEATARIRREGIALTMVVDHSGSMRARDFVSGDTSIDRLEVVKRVFRDFVASREADLIGLVAFARYADGLCPLTLDHRNLAQILDELSIVEDEREDGTAIGEGLALAVERLRTSDAKSKVAIVLTDGVSNAGDIAPRQAADLAAAHGIKVYAIGAGSTGYAPVPFRTAGGRVVLRRARVEIDEATLEAIAERTGGRYFHASDAASLTEVLREIDTLETSELIEERFFDYEEHYAPLVQAALGLMGVSVLLGGSVLRRLP
jgi:Ca-activated chloride channel family protein